MDLKQTIKKVESSKVFKSFIKAHPDYFLAHCFAMLVEGEKEKDIKWELGYYSEKTDKIVVFETEPKVNMRPEEDALRKMALSGSLTLKKSRLTLPMR